MFSWMQYLKSKLRERNIFKRYIQNHFSFVEQNMVKNPNFSQFLSLYIKIVAYGPKFKFCCDNFLFLINQQKGTLKAYNSS